MGSNGRIPPPHLRRPPLGPGIMHPDSFVPGMLPPMPGSFPPFNILPPLEVMEQKLAAQHVDMQKLATENQRLAATHGTLRQELAAAQHELQLLHNHIGVKKSKRELQMKNLTDKIVKMEAELQTAEPVKLELQKANAEAQKLVVAREELMAKVRQLTQDLQRAHKDVQQIPALMSELESLRQEYHHCRGTYECEKKFYNDHLVSLQVMEKNYKTMAMEVEKLRAELTNAPNVDRRAGGSYSGATGNSENETSGRPMGQIAYDDGYGVPQVHVPPPSATTAGGTGVGAGAVPNTSAGAFVGAQSGTPVRVGYDVPRAPGYDGYDPTNGPSYDPTKGPSYDAQKGANYNAQRGPNYDIHRGPSYPHRGPVYDMQRGPGYETQPVPGYDAQRGAGYNAQRGPSYIPQRGPSYDPSRGTTYDGAPRGASGSHGQVPRPLNNLPYGSATPPAGSGSGYEAPLRGGNPARR